MNYNVKYPFMNFMYYKILKDNSAIVGKNKHFSIHLKIMWTKRAISKSWDHIYLEIVVNKLLEKESGH